MKAKVKKENRPVILWILVIAIMVFWTIKSGNFTFQNSWITLFILAFMGGFVIAGQLKGLNPLIHMTKSISSVTARIEQMKSNQEGTLWEQLRKEQSLFHNKKLDSLFEAYKYEMDRLYREHEENVQCDIAEYINEDNIEEEIHVHFLEQLSGIMTGLGILGTFIGLAVGLSQFKNDGVDQMISSIAPLIDGIKVAFYTSIYGVILSLVFNIYYKFCQERFNKSLEVFYHIFYRYVTHNPVNDMANQLLHYQQSQTLAMEQFAETISVQFAKSFQQIAAPTFQQIGDTMSNLSEHMEQTLKTLSDQISNKQKESMEEIVENFITQMNMSLGGSFEQLRNTIDELCEGQQKTAKDVNQLISRLESTIHEIDEIHEASESIVRSLQEYCSNLNSYQEKVNEAYTHVEQQEAIFAELTTKQQACLDSFSNHEAALVTNIGELNEKTKEISKVFKTHAEKFSQYTEQQMDTVKGIYTEFVDDLENSTKKHIEQNRQILEQQANITKAVCQKFGNDLDNTAQKHMEQNEKTFEQMKSVYTEFVDSLDDTAQKHMEQNEKTINQMKSVYTEFVDSLDDTAQKHMEQNQETFEQMKSVYTEFVDGLDDTAQKHMEQNQETINQMKGVYTEFVDSLDDTAQKHMEQNEKTINQMKGVYTQFVGNLDNAAQKHMEQNKQVLGQMVTSLDKSSENLSHIADGFQGNLKGSIDRTFEQFDINLSEIAMRLSGTITEINDTTENIPKALRGTFVTMQKQLEAYVKTIAQLQQEAYAAVEKMKEAER